MSSDEGLEVDRPLRQKNKSFTKTEIQPVLQKNLLPQYASCTDLDMTEDEADGPISELALKGKKNFTLYSSNWYYKKYVKPKKHRI